MERSGCVVCGKELVYTQINETIKCYYCKKISDSHVKCPDNHFVCDECHSADANELIAKHCIITLLENPFDIAIGLMKFPTIKMHGPEHHFLVPASLLAAYYNNLEEPEQKEQKIEMARQRASKVPGGFCGTHGNCGAGVGAGIFVSIISGATSLSEKEWQLSNMITGQCLVKIAESGGPRCCKRDSYISIKEAALFANKNFGSEIKISNVKCQFSDYNKQCNREKCDFFDL